MAEAARQLGTDPRRRCGTCGERFPPDYLVCPRDATPLGVAADPNDPLLGVVLAGSYRITRLLGKGGMGRLYEAEHTRLPRRLAIKVIHDHYADNVDAVARFEREARAAALIDSDHVLDILDVVRTPDDRPCIVAERLEGEDLQVRLDRHVRLSLRESLRIARQLCRGLAAAHAVGVVHRDLKPSNVYLAASAHGHETAKILDFGVAKLLDRPDITRPGAIVGTPAYMAPEQARGAARVDARADVYGVGAVLYRMLTGHAPYEASDPNASLARLLHEPLAPARRWLPDLPEDVEALLERTLARDPDARPADALALERALCQLDPDGDPQLDPSVGARDIPRERFETTLVLPRGSVDGAALTAARLRRARPRALAAAAAITLATGLFASALLSAATRALLPAEHLAGLPAVLIVVAAVATAVLAATASTRALRRAWDAPTHLRTFAARAARALVAALATLGAATVVTRGLLHTPSATLETALLGLPLLAALAQTGRSHSPRQSSRRS